MSVNVEIDLAGGEEFAQAMARLDAELQAQVQQRLGQWAENVKAEAKRLVPVRTGYLRSTIFARTLDWQAGTALNKGRGGLAEQNVLEVGADAPYAAAVEFGTTRAAACPFLQPALERHLPELEQVLVEAVDAAKSEAEL